MTETRTPGLDQPVSIELTIAELMADLDEAWASWQPEAEEDLVELPS